MIEPSAICDNLVALLRGIPDLVAEMDGDAGRIYAYRDQYPKHVSLPLAIHQMPAPAVMVAWQGSGPGSIGNAQVWQHRFSIFLRCRAAMDNEPSPYSRLFRLIVKGVPADSGQPLINAEVHPCCYPMDMPTIARASDEEGLDYLVPLRKV
jgi:hypothetical protein